MNEWFLQVLLYAAISDVSLNFKVLGFISLKILGFSDWSQMLPDFVIVCHIWIASKQAYIHIFVVLLLFIIVYFAFEKFFVKSFILWLSNFIGEKSSFSFFSLYLVLDWIPSLQLLLNSLDILFHQAPLL